MSLSMYQASIPVFLQSLSALSKIIEKAAAYAEVKKINPDALLHARLFPDMFPFIRQVQVTTDHAKGATARLAGVDVPSYPDTETSFSELQARIQKTIEFIKTIKPQQIDGSEEKEITLQLGPNKLSFKGQNYLLHFAIPNFYFHMTSAYGILRHNGLDIGKRDFFIDPRQS